jgi:hypothetical protein
MIENFYLKDIPLTDLKDYLSEDYLNSEDFENTLNLFNSLNEKYEYSHELISSFQTKINFLINILTNKYLDLDYINIITENDILNQYIKLIGELELIKNSLKISENIGDNLILKEIPIKKYFITKKEENENFNLIKNSFESAKTSFLNNYNFNDFSIEDENLFIELKRAISFKEKPLFFSNKINKNSLFLLELLDYNIIELNEEMSSIILNVENISNNKLEKIYSFFADFLSKKYFNINFSDSIKPEMNDIKYLILEKYEKSYKDHEIFNFQSNETNFNFKLKYDTVESFLEENNIMQEYEIR